jgi:hypothetical protein
LLEREHDDYDRDDMSLRDDDDDCSDLGDFHFPVLSCVHFYELLLRFFFCADLKRLGD